MAANIDGNEEPSSGPEPNRWYDITLGSSFKDDRTCSPMFCTMRYEFKPASIDNKPPGKLHKSKDNRVRVEFQNDQLGKPKVSFEGVTEDYKDNDAVLFFDGENFRLEKLHRAVKRLRYVQVSADSMADSAPVPAASIGPTTDIYSSPVSRGTLIHPSDRVLVQSVHVEEIDINNPVNPEHGTLEEDHSGPNPNAYENEENVNIDDDDVQVTTLPENTSVREFRTGGLDIDINLPHPAELEDDEIADVDVNVNDDDAEKGLNAAEALRAQVNAELKNGHNQDSSTTSGSQSSETESESSESGSGTSSSGSESSGSGSGTVSESSSRASH